MGWLSTFKSGRRRIKIKGEWLKKHVIGGQLVLTGGK